MNKCLQPRMLKWHLTSLATLTLTNQPLIAAWIRIAAFSRSLPAFRASLAAFVDSKKASLLSLLVDSMICSLLRPSSRKF